jgi:uncharacterized membrane protein
MKIAHSIKIIGIVLSIATLIFGFLLFYSQTKEPIGSLSAAVLTSALVWGSFTMLYWLAEVFVNKK